MVAKQIVDSDTFLDMPQSSQNLYFHLIIRADDEGFINSPLKIMRMIGANKNDMEILLAKRYLLKFDSGVIVVKHWKLHNSIRKDRLKETIYLEEKSQLMEKENGSYTDRQPNDNQMTTKSPHRLVEISLDKSRLEECIPVDEKPTKQKPKKKKYLEFVLLSDEEFNKLVDKFGESGAKHRIKDMDDGIAIKGYKYKSHYRAILKWAEKDTQGSQQQSTHVKWKNPELYTETEEEKRENAIARENAKKAAQKILRGKNGR